MVEVTERGKRAIQSDILTQQHKLNERQTAAIRYLLENGKITIQDFEALYPAITRRSLQRDLRLLLEKGLVVASGATNRLEYKLL